MALFTEIIKEQVYNKIDTSIKIKQADHIGNNTYFKACGLKWLLATFKLYIDNNEYYYKKSNLNGYDFMIENIDLSSFTSIKLSNFNWYIGTYKEVNTEWQTDTNIQSDKLPILWFSFQRPPRTSVINEASNPVKEIHDFVMYFCAGISFSDFRTEDVLNDQVNAINSYVEEFIKAIKNNTKYFLTNDKLRIDKEYYPKFGEIKENKTILDAQLSAIAVDFRLHQLVQCCECEC